LNLPLILSLKVLNPWEDLNLLSARPAPGELHNDADDVQWQTAYEDEPAGTDKKE